ncbi:hypothetical protein [Azospirillum palustre]
MVWFLPEPPILIAAGRRRDITRVAPAANFYLSR